MTIEILLRSNSKSELLEQTPRKNLNAERKGQCRMSTFPQVHLPLVLLNCKAWIADILWDQRLRKEGRAGWLPGLNIERTRVTRGKSVEISVFFMGLTNYDYLEMENDLRTKIYRCSAAHFRSQCAPLPASTKPTPSHKSETVNY